MDEKIIVELSKKCAHHIEEKKGEDVVLMDISEVNSYLDYFIIATGNSHVHCRSIAKAVTKFLTDHNMTSKNKADFSSGWIILDYGYLIIHVFTEEMRDFYGLEKLWGDANFLSIS